MARAGAQRPANKALEAVERAKNAPFRPTQDDLAAARGLDQRFPMAASRWSATSRPRWWWTTRWGAWSKKTGH